MKYAIVGTGEVGQSLAAGLLAIGHEVRMGSRSASNKKAVEWAESAGPRASTGTFADAASFGEVLFLATLGSTNEAVISLIPKETLKGKIIIDVTNPLDFSDGSPKLALGHTDSGGEQVQRLAPDSKVVKAFNTVGHAHFFKPEFKDGPPDMFICGNHEDAKNQVSTLIEEFGWGVVDLGGIECSRYLEPMCMAWVIHGLRSGSWNHAYKLLQK